jgi:hypothetical protein
MIHIKDLDFGINIIRTIEMEISIKNAYTRRNPPKMQLMHLQLCVTNPHLQLALIIFAIIFHL